MQSLIGTQSRWLVLAGAVGLSTGLAAAGSVTALSFGASNSNGTGAFVVSMDDGTTLPDGTFVWSLTSPTDIVDTDTGASIAHILAGSIMLGSSGVVSHSFVVQAGGVDTSFSIGSALVNTGLIQFPFGRASAGVTLTDNNGDGANMTGDIGGSMFESYYDAGSVFADLIGGPFGFATGFDTRTTSDEFPGGAGNFAAFAGPVTEIGINWGFTLSAGDSSGGTSVFVVIPAPASLGFIAGAGLFMGRRRR